MKTLIEKIKKILSHNQGLTVAIIIVASLLVWINGCESQVTSIVQPDKMVTRNELNVEISSEAARLELELEKLTQVAAYKMQELDKQDEIKNWIGELGALAASGGEINPAGLAVSLLALLGFGAAVDNRIKDKVIKNRPLNT